MKSNINKIVTFDSKTFVIKSFSYFGSNKKIKELLFEQKSSFKEIKDYEKQLFHKTGMDKSESIYHFSPKRLSDKNYAKKEKDDYMKSSIVVYSLNISTFDDFVFKSIKNEYQIKYNLIDNLIKDNINIIRDNNIEKQLKEIFNKKYNKTHPVFETIIKNRKRLAKYNKEKKEIDDFALSMSSSSVECLKEIGVELKKLQSISNLYRICEQSANNPLKPIFDNVFIVLGKYNVAAFCYEKNKRNEFNSNMFFSNNNVFNQMVKKEIGKTKKGICGTMDGYSDLLKYIDLNSFFKINSSNDFFLKMNTRGETKRAIFIKAYADNDLINELANLNFQTKCIFVKNISFFYNLLCVSVCYYRSVSFESLVQRTTNNKLFVQKNGQYECLLERMNWINGKEKSGELKNKAPINNSENFFIDFSTLVYGYIQPINKLLQLNTSPKAKMVDDIQNDHYLRFRADDIFYSITSSVIYLSLLSRICSALKTELDFVNTKVFIFKISAIRTYINLYNKSLIIYNQPSLFSTQEKTIFHCILIDSMRIEDTIEGISRTSSVAWESANISNGFIFPIMQVLIAIVTYILMFNICSNLGYTFWARFGLSSAAVIFVFLLYGLIHLISNIGLRSNQLRRLAIKQMNAEKKY